MQTQINQYKKLIRDIRQNQDYLFDGIKGCDKRIDGTERCWKNGRNRRRHLNRMRKRCKAIEIGAIIRFLTSKFEGGKLGNLSIKKIDDYPFELPKDIVRNTRQYLLQVPKSRLEIIETLLDILTKEEDVCFLQKDYIKMKSNSSKYQREEIMEARDEYDHALHLFLDERNHFISWTSRAILAVLNKDFDSLKELNRDMEIDYDF